jgi:predicted RNA binding protein YcfA (HicA-like mRNA interferase family)
MPKLGPFTATELIRLLEKHGFMRVRQAGSHIILRRDLAEADSVSLVVPNHRDIARGTLQSIVRQSGLDPKLFRK